MEVVKLIKCDLLECEFNWYGECGLLVNEKEKKLLKPNLKSCPFFRRVPDEVLVDREAFLELENLLFDYIEDAIEEVSRLFGVESELLEHWAWCHFLSTPSGSEPDPFSWVSRYLEWKRDFLEKRKKRCETVGC